MGEAWFRDRQITMSILPPHNCTQKRLVTEVPESQDRSACRKVSSGKGRGVKGRRLQDEEGALTFVMS